MKPIMVMLLCLGALSAGADVAEQTANLDGISANCKVQVFNEDGNSVQAFEAGSCTDAVIQCQSTLAGAGVQNVEESCIVEGVGADWFRPPFPPPFPFPFPPHRPPFPPPGPYFPPPAPYPPPHPHPYPPPYPPPAPYPPPHPHPYPPPYPHPAPYPPPHPHPYPPPYQPESWTCIANDRGHEEHRGGHPGYGQSQSEAADNAMHVCLLSHGKCSISNCSSDGYR